jgi:hypothetical protein
MTLTYTQKDWLQTWAGSFLLAPFALYFATSDPINDPSALNLLVHSANLIVHEAGHFFFRFFRSQFVMVAGGSILQLALPALFVWQGLVWNNRLGTQVSLLWLGQNFVDVSVYAADAQARALPLIGNLPIEAHDWHFLMSAMGLLDQTPFVAGVIYGFAFVPWAAMLVVPRWVG